MGIYYNYKKRLKIGGLMNFVENVERNKRLLEICSAI